MADMMRQVALVTGGVRGIGLAICEHPINRGVRVAAGYSSNQDAAQAFRDKHAGQGPTIHQGNIGSNEDCLRVIDEVLDAHGQLDILVNNADITVNKTIRKMTPAQWDRVIHVNLSGPFYLSRAILQHMLDQGYGRIVNISPVIGSAGGFGQANYAAAKSGMFGLTMSLALETAGKGITVNTVTPGLITTDMTAAVPAAAIFTGAPLRHRGARYHIGVARLSAGAAGAVNRACPNSGEAGPPRLCCTETARHRVPHRIGESSCSIRSTGQPAHRAGRGRFSPPSPPAGPRLPKAASRTRRRWRGQERTPSARSPPRTAPGGGPVLAA
jgi:acetoacetyl-CoA reductase